MRSGRFPNQDAITKEGLIVAAAIVTRTLTNRYQDAVTNDGGIVTANQGGNIFEVLFNTVGQSMTSTVSVMLAVVERLCHNVGNNSISVSLTEAHPLCGCAFFCRFRYER